jgi:GNAT superfamily N-acetyltransferase
MALHIRRASLEDLAILVSFTLAEALEAEGIERSAERVTEGVLAGLEDPAVAMYWVMESPDASLVGSISVVREWSDWNGAYYWWIQSLYIKPEFRGQGLLKPLIEVVREEAKRQGALELRLYAHRSNERALSAYRREGFRELPYQVMSLEL